MAGNEGQSYEKRIRAILKDEEFLPAIIPPGIDAAFTHRGASYNVEVKNTRAHDFGQVKITWDKFNGWSWNEKNDFTDYLERFNVFGQIKKDFEPKKFTVSNDDKFKEAHRRHDRTNFKFDTIVKVGDQDTVINIATIETNDSSLINRYYAQKNCYYIQIEDSGFYSLERNAANLGKVPRFVPANIKIRLRAKRHHSYPEYNYSFFAVLVAYPKSVFASEYDIEKKDNREFPPFA